MTDLVDNPMLLPDPEPAEVRFTIISVDDHLVEPVVAEVSESSTKGCDERERSRGLGI